MTALESCDTELKEAKRLISEQDRTIARFKVENVLLQRQVFRFRNIKEDRTELTFLTGISTDVWSML